MNSFRFVAYERPGEDVSHIVRVLVSARDAQFLGLWAATFAAVNDQECVMPGYDRVLTGTRVTWRVIARELELYARDGDPTPDDMTQDQRYAMAWCEAIRVRVWGEAPRYFGEE